MMIDEQIRIPRVYPISTRASGNNSTGLWVATDLSPEPENYHMRLSTGAWCQYNATAAAWYVLGATGTYSVPGICGVQAQSVS